MMLPVCHAHHENKKKHAALGPLAAAEFSACAAAGGKSCSIRTSTTGQLHRYCSTTAQALSHHYRQKTQNSTC
jgi:hypothetical protein